jgi:hypothetical protein
VGADVLAVAVGEFAMLLGSIERGGQFEVGPGLPEIADHQLRGPKNPVADQARRRSGLPLRQLEKLLRVFHRPLGVPTDAVRSEDAVEDREVKRCSSCRRLGDELSSAVQGGKGFRMGVAPGSDQRRYQRDMEVEFEPAALERLGQAAQEAETAGRGAGAGAAPAAASRKAPIAASSLRRCPIEVTPRPIKSSALSSGKISASMSLSRKAGA